MLSRFASKSLNFPRTTEMVSKKWFEVTLTQKFLESHLAYNPQRSTRVSPRLRFVGGGFPSFRHPRLAASRPGPSALPTSPETPPETRNSEFGCVACRSPGSRGFGAVACWFHLSPRKGRLGGFRKVASFYSTRSRGSNFRIQSNKGLSK